jgi:potassium voltage-gated channel Shaw-related subfamily C protein 1
MDNDNKIILNIGGTRYETNKTTLKKIPATRLSRLTEALANYDSLLNEYFFDRHPGVFSQVLNYYRTGKLHYPTNVCGPLFETELEFWGLDSNQVEPCCWKTYTKHRDTEETLATLERLALDEDGTPKEELARKFSLEDDPRWHNGTLPFYLKIKPIVWQLFEEPNSSKFAKVISRISIGFIIISILTYCLSTVNGICQSDFFCQTYTIYVSVENSDVSKSINVLANANRDRSTILDYIEYICIAWFTLEFTVRFFVSPYKTAFLKSPLNWIDFCANLWFYCDLTYNQFLDDYHASTHPAWDLFGTIRIFRLFKFMNHHKGLKIIIASLKASAGILRIIIFFVAVAIIIFASLIYYSEKLTGGRMPTIDIPHYPNGRYSNQYVNDNEFISIVEAIWFSVQSLTTVGFGDYVPKTVLGMIFGAICTVTGVLMIDLPMPIIVQNFANYYNHLQARSKLPKKLRRRVVDLPRSYRISTQSNSKALLTTKLNSRSPDSICFTQSVLNNGAYAVGFHNKNNGNNNNLVLFNINKLNKFDVQNT